MEQSKEERVLIGAYVTVSERERLRELAKREDLAMSQVIRRALRAYLDQVDFDTNRYAFLTKPVDMTATVLSPELFAYPPKEA